MGTNLVADDNGWGIVVGAVSPAVNFREVIVAGGHVRADTIYFDAAVTGEKVDFMAVMAAL